MLLVRSCSNPPLAAAAAEPAGKREAAGAARRGGPTRVRGGARGRHGLGGEAGPRLPRVRADGAELPRPAHLRALLRRQGRGGPELVPGLRDG